MRSPEAVIEGSPGRRRRPSHASFGRWASYALEPLSVILGVGAVVLLLWVLGYPPSSVLSALWEGSLSTNYAFENSLGYAIPLGLVGVSVWLAYTSGLFNIGGEGQLQWGGLAGLMIGLHVDLGTPYLTIPVALLAGAAAGAIWAGVAGVLKVARGANEVISTVMLNYIAILLVVYLVNNPLKDPQVFTAATSPLDRGLRLDVELAALVAAAVAAVAVVVVRYSSRGISMRALGSNTAAAEQAGVRVGRVWLATMLASGAIAGLAGALEIYSVQFKVSSGWVLNWGLLGIVVAFLSTRRPWLLALWAFIFGALQAAGPAMKATASVPDGAVTLMLIAPLFALFALRRGFARLPGNETG